MRQVALSRVPVDAHRREGARGDEKHPRDALAGEHEEHRGKRDTHQRRINPVQRLCGTGLHALNAIAEPHDEAERCQHDQPDQRRARERGIKPGLGKDQGDDAGQRQPRRHVVVDAEHIVAQADIDVCLCACRRPHRPAGLRTESHETPYLRAARLIPRCSILAQAKGFSITPPGRALAVWRAIPGPDFSYGTCWEKFSG